MLYGVSQTFYGALGHPSHGDSERELGRWVCVEKAVLGMPRTCGTTFPALPNMMCGDLSILVMGMW